MFPAVLRNPGCLYRIPDPNFSIPDPGSKRLGSRIRNPHQSIFFNPKIVSKLTEIWYGMFIPDPDLDFLPNQDLGFWIQGSKRHRIPDPDPQHWLPVPPYRYRLCHTSSPIPVFRSTMVFIPLIHQVSVRYSDLQYWCVFWFLCKIPWIEGVRIQFPTVVIF